MGLRFYRRFKVLPGVTLNLSRRGLSTSIGTRGAHVTVGHGQTRETVGVPGTGLSWTESQSTRRTAAARAADVPRGRFTFGRVLRWLALGVLSFWCVSMAIVWAIARL